MSNGYEHICTYRTSAHLLDLINNIRVNKLKDDDLQLEIYLDGRNLLLLIDSFQEEETHEYLIPSAEFHEGYTHFFYNNDIIFTKIYFISNATNTIQ